MDFSSTRVVNNWQKKNKECETCKSIEVLNHQACDSNCLGDSKRENHLIAQKINQKLTRPIDAILSQSLQYSHKDLREQIAKLETEISQFKAKTSNLPNILKEFSSISDKLPRRAAKESKIVNFEQRIKNLDENLNRLEYDLSTKAAEHYDNFDRASIIPLDESQFEEKPNIQVYLTEIQDQNRQALEIGQISQNQRLLLDNFQKNDPSLPHKIIEFKQEFDESKKKAEMVDGQIKRIEDMQKAILEKMHGQLSSLNDIKQKNETLRRKQETVSVLKPSELITVTENIFHGRRHLKQYQEFTKTSIVTHLNIFRNIPALQSQISSFTAEISRYQ